MNNFDFKAGYIDRPDSMRDLAEKLGGPNLSPQNNNYKKGGCVKLAAGGAAKVRKEVCTPAGKPIQQKRGK